MFAVKKVYFLFIHKYGKDRTKAQVFILMKRCV